MSQHALRWHSTNFLQKRTGPLFFQTVAIYDIAQQTWYIPGSQLPYPDEANWHGRYTQNTTGDIPQTPLASFCAVVASAADGSSHNIYVYGGYDGLSQESTPSDDVFILSLPSFQWSRAYTGTSTHGRSGHQCIRVFPDQMLVIGGQYKDPTFRLDGGIIQNFNLNQLRFQDDYHPDRWEAYQVPKMVTDRIGGRYGEQH